MNLSRSPNARWRRYLTPDERMQVSALERAMDHLRRQITKLASEKRTIWNKANQRSLRVIRGQAKARLPPKEPAWKKWAKLAGERS